MRKRRRQRGRKWTPESGQRAANARWQRERAARAADPIRHTRIVEFPIRDTHRPFALVRLEAEETERGFGRWLVTQNGARIGRRRFGRSAVAKLVAGFLQ